ncbi:MAG TPA: hypothetical protein VLL54_11715 [Pyrinomonadaceae bacterium]|nr:hypothetical protein [Pyrinomonadaceae bacterium]
MIQVTRCRLARRRSTLFALGSLIFLSATFLANGQTLTSGVAKPEIQTTSSPNSKIATNRDEVFELNIVERRYDEQNFTASTAVSIDPNSPKLGLQVGVALAAKNITVVLKNVHGVVRFRGTLDRILQAINDHKRPPAEDAQALPD